MTARQIILGTTAMLPQLGALYDACRAAMQEQGIHQWGPDYPNVETCAYHIEHGTLYALVDGAGTVLGVQVLNTWQPEEYEWVQWSEVPDATYLLIHSLAVHPAHQGTGCAKQLLRFAEAFAQEHGHTGVRLDAYSRNPGSLHLYESQGYACVGAVYFDTKPQPYNWYNCYEKLF